MQRNPLKAYTEARRESVAGPDVEIIVLEKAAMNFRRAGKNWEATTFNKELDTAVKFNQRVWDVFQSDWRREDCALPQEVRQNLLNLSIFVRKTSLEIIAKPSKELLETLISINENLAEGLREGRERGKGNVPSGENGAGQTPAQDGSTPPPSTEGEG